MKYKHECDWNKYAHVFLPSLDSWHHNTLSVAAAGQAQLVSLRDEQWKACNANTKQMQINVKYKPEYESSYVLNENTNTEMESEKQVREGGVKEKVEDKHSLVFFICAWLGVGGY